MEEMELRSIGMVKHTDRGFVIQVDEAFRKGLEDFDVFGHINVLWWFSDCDATEAVKVVLDFCFSKAELKRIWTDVDVRNGASVRVLEKAGFRREGTIRQGKMVSTWCDYHIYGILSAS